MLPLVGSKSTFFSPLEINMYAFNTTLILFYLQEDSEWTAGWCGHRTGRTTSLSGCPDRCYHSGQHLGGSMGSQTLQ